MQKHYVVPYFLWDVEDLKLFIDNLTFNVLSSEPETILDPENWRQVIT